jgi:hypothetical protein
MTTTITPVDAANISEGTGGTIALGKEINIASEAVAGGTIYITTVRGSGNSDPAGVSTVFAPLGAGGTTRRVKLSDVKTVAGVPVTAAAQANIFGLTFTPGTAEYLVSEAANSNTKTDVAAFEVILSDTYVAGTALNVIANANYVIGAGTLTTKTLAVAAYLVHDDDTESSTLETTAAQTITGSAADYTYAVTGTTLTPGARLVLTLTMALTETAGSNVTGRVNSVRLSPA